MGVAAAHSPGLVEPLAAVLAGIGSVNQQGDLALARGDFDPLGTIDQRATASFEAEAVERLLAQGGFDAPAEIGRNVDGPRLERSG